MRSAEYWLIHTVPTDEKGMLQKPRGKRRIVRKKLQQQGVTQLNCVAVESIGEYAEKVKKLGGKILVSKR
jgi:predicted enzyme related to lactoylglutathione lyase